MKRSRVDTEFYIVEQSALQEFQKTHIVEQVSDAGDGDCAKLIVEARPLEGSK